METQTAAPTTDQITKWRAAFRPVAAAAVAEALAALDRAKEKDGRTAANPAA